MPRIWTEIGSGLSLQLLPPSVGGYDYSDSDQPYHVELWIEKSTMNDVLLPLCRELGLNLVSSIGFQSITGAIALLRRVVEIGKPARVFYISDFDPAGDGMPVAVARQLQFWIEEYAPGADIKLTPLALTREQVLRYQLPRIPVKETDRRKAGFEERRGEGAVELDALQALHPGVLAQLVRQAVQPYRDPTLSRRLIRAESEAESIVEDAWETAVAPFRDALQEIEAEAGATLARYEKELERLRDRMDADLQPVRDRLETVRQAVQERLDLLDVELPDRPEPEAGPGDETHWLFDAGRDYMEQLEAYKAHKNGEAEDPGEAA